MERIIELIDSLIELLEREKRINDIFAVSPRERKENFIEENEYQTNLESNQLFNDLYDVLTAFINYKPIEIIKYDQKSNLKGEQSSEIVWRARELSSMLSIQERDEPLIIQMLFSRGLQVSRIIYLKCLLLVYLCSSSYEYDYSIENLDLVKKHVIGEIFYRGHPDIKYTIIPSMIRSLNRTCTIDYPFIEKKYLKSNLFDKYKECVDRGATINYDFCSFIQHATSYSPLIDFTKDENIALSFATYPNGNLNVYNSVDASLILLAVKKDKDFIDIKNINLDYHASKLTMKSLIYGKPLSKCTLRDFDVSFGLSTKATNDRMKYQKGVFFCFYRCVIVKGIPLIPWSKGYLITLRIKSKDNAKPPLEDKPSIYNRIINSQRHLEFDHLMNPYDYFGEYNK